MRDGSYAGRVRDLENICGCRERETPRCERAGDSSRGAAMAPTAHAIIARPLIGTAVLMGAASTFVAMNNGVQYSFSPTALTASGWLSGKTKSGDAGPPTRSIVSLIMRE